MISERQTVGVFGVGDLGAQLVNQLAWTGHDVVAYDPVVNKLQSDQAIDAALRPEPSGVAVVRLVDSPDEVLRSATIIHWAAPPDQLAAVADRVDGQLIVLHSSAMADSAQAIEWSGLQRAAIVHCIMNQAKRVFVADSLADSQLMVEHMAAIGLQPQLIDALEHDQMMAWTQGVFALLIATGIGDTLRHQADLGNLTPSAEELFHAVSHRESQWTAETLQSIISNRQLKTVINAMQGYLTASEGDRLEEKRVVNGQKNN